MAEFPDDIYTPRETENLPGLVYDPADKKNLYSEDFQNLGGEINAIEETLGTNPEGAFATVKAWLTDLASKVLLGMPSGGTTGQVLSKVDDDDYDTEWIDPPAGGGGVVKAIRANRTMSSSSGTQTIAHGLSGEPSSVSIFALLDTSAGPSFSQGLFDGTSKAEVFYVGGGGSDMNNSEILRLCDGAQNVAQYITGITWDATNIYLAWTKVGSPTGTLYMTIEVRG